MRKAVISFAEAMGVRLKGNDYKGGWGKDKCSQDYLERRIIEEFAEYLGSKSCETGNVPEWELVDIANFCMMLYHRLLDNESCQH